MKNKEEFNLKEKIFTANNKSKTFIELYNLEIILKEFIRRQFQIIEEVLSVKDAMRIEKEFKKLSGDLNTQRGTR